MISKDKASQYLTYNSDTGDFFWKVKTRGRKVGDKAGRFKDGCMEIRLDGQDYRAHILAWIMFHGDMPLYRVRHKDGDRANNAIANLECY